MKLIFITGNKNKLREAREILHDFDVENQEIDLPEFQGEPHFIATEKARIAAQKLGCAVFVDDTNLCFEALHGLPGPYIKDFLTKLGPLGLVKLLSAYDDKRARAVALIGFCEPGKEPLVFEGSTPGTIVSPKGSTHFGWDPIFLPEGYEKTYAEMESETKNKISHRYKALAKFRDYLKRHC